MHASKLLFSETDIQTNLQVLYSSFHPRLQGWFRSLSALLVIHYFFSRLGCVSVLKFCWVSVAAFWLHSVQHQPTTGLMRSRFESFPGLEWDTDTVLAPKGCNHTTQPSRCFVNSCNARVNVQTVVCFPTWKCFSLVSVRLCMITLSRIHSPMSYLTKIK